MYELTIEQKDIVAEVVNPTSPTLSVLATAGASKSTTICEAVRQLVAAKPQSKVQCLIFNTVPAAELKSEIGRIAVVSTLHALAYGYVVKQYKLNPRIAGYLTWRHIPSTVKRPFGTDAAILEHIESFCCSRHLTIESYFDELSYDGIVIRPGLKPIIRKLLNLMASGKMSITHSFYLKFFHFKVMTGVIKLPAVDLLIIDEAQDSSSITLDIFEKIPANHRVLVGDRSQRIYEFLNLEDGFLRYPDAKQLTLSKSFRVDSKFAPSIQLFLRKHLESSDYVFEGMDYPADAPIVTRAYLTRTNSSLIGKMIELNQCGTPYKLATKGKLSTMFKFPLAIVYAKPGFQQKDPELQHLQADIDEWGALPLAQREEISRTKWILKQNADDNRIKQAVKLLMKFGRDDIIAAYQQADAHLKVVCDYTLSTGFAVKGASYDAVELDPDVGESIIDLIDRPQSELTPDERAELAHYFVCCTRHRHELVGADYLTQLA